jgi:hypothetical protein
MTVVGVTGHRLQRFNGWENASFQLFSLALAALKQQPVKEVVSGMALGWDMQMGLAARELGIPLVASVPFPQQPMYWPDEYRKTWEDLIDYSYEVVTIAPEYSVSALFQRNIWIVDYVKDKEGIMLALYDLSPKGGTHHACSYAISQKVPLYNVWPSWVKYAK